MSKLRNRNIRTKINAVTKWGHNFANVTSANSQVSGKLFESGGVTSTADSGIGELQPATKLNYLRTRTRRDNCNIADQNLEQNDSLITEMDLSEDDSQHSISSVDTLKVLEEIRNLEDSVKSTSADSYNSWNEEYENDNTQLVKAEFERMERVLQREEGIPAHYDKEEYKLWIKTFPLLSLVSRSGRTSSLEFPKDSQQFERLDQCSTPQFCDTSLTPTPVENTAKNTPEHVLKYPQLFEKQDNSINPKSKHPTTTSYSSKYLGINNTINPRTLNISGEHSFLQLAPLNLSSTTYRRQSFKLNSTSGNKPSNTTRRNTTSIYSCNRTGDWLKDTCKGFPQHANNSSHNNNYSNYSNYFNFAHNHIFGSPERLGRLQRRKSSKTESSKSSSEFIVLPPIEAKEMRSTSSETMGNGIGKGTLPAGRLKHTPVYPLYENDRESDHNDGFTSYRHRKRKF